MNHAPISLEPAAARGGQGVGAPWLRRGMALEPVDRFIAPLQSS